MNFAKSVNTDTTVIYCFHSPKDLHGQGVDDSTVDSTVYPRDWGLNSNKCRGIHGDGVTTGDNTADTESASALIPR